MHLNIIMKCLKTLFQMNRNKTLESLIVIMREEVFEPCKSLLKTPRTANKLIYNALDSIQSYSTCRKKII